MKIRYLFIIKLLNPTVFNIYKIFSFRIINAPKSKRMKITMTTTLLLISHLLIGQNNVNDYKFINATVQEQNHTSINKLTSPAEIISDKNVENKKTMSAKAFNEKKWQKTRKQIQRNKKRIYNNKKSFYASKTIDTIYLDPADTRESRLSGY